MAFACVMIGPGYVGCLTPVMVGSMIGLCLRGLFDPFYGWGNDRPLVMLVV